jgi:hypothetical protein
MGRHPEVRSHMASPLWERIKARFRLIDPDAPDRHDYVVQGDMVGTEDDLFVDVLARGSAVETSDRLARELFERLSSADQANVMRELRRQP